MKLHLRFVYLTLDLQLSSSLNMTLEDESNIYLKHYWSEGMFGWDTSIYISVEACVINFQFNNRYCGNVLNYMMMIWKFLKNNRNVYGTTIWVQEMYRAKSTWSSCHLHEYINCHLY